MRQVRTLITALTVVCIAGVCLAALVTFMLGREIGRTFRSGRAAALPRAPAPLVPLTDRSETP